ncbi:IS110 family transposase [Spirosoma endophyticum]|uniref:Transposase n=1 Tax=Spirosoma endophyticum TaxID=662367 RepID=A0A1I2EU24_9BACT|nr:transposase [Spirosoma endophyticum]SFE95958.1 Transposase [Spirosoma endophyticum]
MKTLLRYCAGLDVSKDSLQVCLAVIDSDGRVVVKASTKVANKASSFSALLKWVGGHCKQNLPLRYVMEATGVYHEQIAWFLYQHEQTVSVILPTKAHHYLRSLGQNRADFYGLNKGWRIIFVIFFAPFDDCIDSMDEFIS